MGLKKIGDDLAIKDGQAAVEKPISNQLSDLVNSFKGLTGVPDGFTEVYENAVIKLINQHEFYAHILMQLKLQLGNKVPLAGVGMKGGYMTLYINPHPFMAVTLEDRTALLIHECAHIMLGHTTHRKADFKNHVAANYAMDAAIHEIENDVPKAPNLKHGVITVPRLEESLKITLKREQTTDYYYDKMRDAVKGQTGHDFDSHDFMEGDLDGDQDAAKGMTAEILANAIRKTKEGAGKVPAAAELTLERLNKTKVNWRAALRRYIGSSTTEETRLSRNKRNRRLGLARPGKRKRFEPLLTLIIDTSGSMSGAPLEQVYAEMTALGKLGYDIRVIEADCEVSRPAYTFNAKKLVNFTGGGGTAYQPGIDEAVKLRSDLIIYMGDMDSSDVPTDPRIPFVWLVVGDQEPPGKFGLVLKVDA